MGQLQLMPTPLGVSNPLYEFELAESLHMTVSEIRHGRGTPMSAWELCIGWPEYHAYKAREQKKQQEKMEGSRRRRL
jgi:hypothetical protein